MEENCKAPQMILVKKKLGCKSFDDRKGKNKATLARREQLVKNKQTNKRNKETMYSYHTKVSNVRWPPPLHQEVLTGQF